MATRRKGKGPMNEITKKQKITRNQAVPSSILQQSSSTTTGSDSEIIQSVCSSGQSTAQEQINQGENIEINLFDVLDDLVHNSNIPTEIESLKKYRLRQFMTYHQLFLFDSIHDMVIGKRSGWGDDTKNIFMKNIFKKYYNLMKETWSDIIGCPTKGVCNAFYEFVRNNVYDKSITKDADNYMLRIFKIFDRKGNIDDALFTIFKNDLEENKDGLGDNVSNFYPIQACEILGVRPISFTGTVHYRFPEYTFKNFIKDINTDNKSISDIDFTVDMTHSPAEFATVSKIAGCDYDYVDNKYPIGFISSKTYISTPGKLYDKTGNPTQLLNYGMGSINEIFMKTTTVKYNIFFKDDSIKFDSIFLQCNTNQKTIRKNKKNVDECKLIIDRFCDVIYNNKVGIPEKSEVSHVASKISTILNNRDQCYYIAAYKFCGDFLQSIWHFYLNKINTRNLKIHISGDTISACICSLFGGIVVMTNKALHNFNGNHYGGLEYYLIKSRVYDKFDINIRHGATINLLDALLIESIGPLIPPENISKVQPVEDIYEAQPDEDIYEAPPLNQQQLNFIEDLIPNQPCLSGNPQINEASVYANINETGKHIQKATSKPRTGRLVQFRDRIFTFFNTRTPNKNIRSGGTTVNALPNEGIGTVTPAPKRGFFTSNQKPSFEETNPQYEHTNSGFNSQAGTPIKNQQFGKKINRLKSMLKYLNQLKIKG
jgi:hypothetical protein